MSEYQYYEFKALDELLTQAQISRPRGYSSRGPITPEGQVGFLAWTTAWEMENDSTRKIKTQGRGSAGGILAEFAIRAWEKLA